MWDGNEVWLLAAGCNLFFAFPLAYATAFSGFYLPLMIVLWLLILRGVSSELRGHSTDLLWRSVFDGLFSFSSVLLTISSELLFTLRVGLVWGSVGSISPSYTLRSSSR